LRHRRESARFAEMLANITFKTWEDPEAQAFFSEMQSRILNPSPGIYHGYLHTSEVTEGDILDEYPEVWPVPEHNPMWSRDSTGEERMKFLRQVIENGQWFEAYGVADNMEQVLEKYKPYVDDPGHCFCFTFCELTREENPGWRWHKNGTYIGVREPQCEHLGDEPDIDSVITFHVYRVKRPD